MVMLIALSPWYQESIAGEQPVGIMTTSDLRIPIGLYESITRMGYPKLSS
jgi:hypothetical protein